jgi:Fe2+ transport system protein FeoA
MIRCGSIGLVLLALGFVADFPVNADKKDTPGVKIDKDKRTITIDAKIAPRKLPIYTEIYPIEVIACYEHPKGKKAHETVVTIEAKPSAIHQALVEFGLKPGAPIMGGKEVPKGPEVKIYIEVPTPTGETKKLTMDKVLVDKNGKPFPKTVSFRFTGSVQKQPDPTKKDTIYAADDSGTLIVIFPVSNETVLQTSLSMEFEPVLKLETNTKVLPKEGTPVKLILEVPR